MLHWKKLLQTTGGDLAPHKCTVMILKWKWGSKTRQAALMRKDETPGTIILTNINDGKLEIDWVIFYGT